jgi:AraC-like DNA-binding protein
MKPVLLPITVKPDSSFSIRNEVVPHFFKELHFHPEVEIVWIKKGSGVQYVGNNLRPFKPDDLIVVGADLQHLWKCDEAYFKGNSKLKAESVVIHFLPDIMPDFLNLPENKTILQLLEKSKAGLMVFGKTKQQVAAFLIEMLTATPARKLLILFEILHLLAASKQVQLLNKRSAIASVTNKKNERMNDVLQYILKNYKSACSLEQAADIANMSVHAFCRFFKHSTKKSFTTFLNEIRLHQCCKLLQETSKPIHQFSYECGFENLSNFNRQFRKMMNTTPLQYRKQYQMD